MFDLAAHLESTYYADGASSGPIFWGLLIIGLVCGAIAARIWENKGGSPRMGFGIGLLLGLIGLVVVGMATPSTPSPNLRVPRNWFPAVGDFVMTRYRTRITGTRDAIPAGQEMRVIAIDKDVVEAELPDGERHAFGIKDIGPKPQAFEHRATGGQAAYDDEIRRLAKLKDEGHLSQDEFQAKKKQLLSL